VEPYMRNEGRLNGKHRMSSSYKSTSGVSAAPLIAVSRCKTHCISRSSQLGKGRISGSSVVRVKVSPDSIPRYDLSSCGQAKKYSIPSFLALLKSFDDSGSSSRSTGSLLPWLY
jgi:hypothetical protein